MDKSNLRALAHGRLLDWARLRGADLEALGWSANSATEVMRQRAHGGGASTAPGELTLTEAQCDRVGRTLQTELAVRSLCDEQRVVVFARYAADRTISVWAGERGIPQGTAYARLSRGVENVGGVLFAWMRRLSAPETSAAARGERLAREMDRLRPDAPGRDRTREDSNSTCNICKDVAELSYVAVTVPEKNSKRRNAPLLRLPNKPSETCHEVTPTAHPT